MANRLRDLLSVYEACVISGGKFDQFKLQLKDRLDLTPMQMSRVHIMPTSGRTYLRFDDRNRDRVLQDTEDLAPETRAEIVDILTGGESKLGYWGQSHMPLQGGGGLEIEPAAGPTEKEIVVERGSNGQVTSIDVAYPTTNATVYIPPTRSGASFLDLVELIDVVWDR